MFMCVRAYEHVDLCVCVYVCVCVCVCALACLLACVSVCVCEGHTRRDTDVVKFQFINFQTQQVTCSAITYYTAISAHIVLLKPTHNLRNILQYNKHSQKGPQHASVSQERICSDNLTSCKTENLQIQLSTSPSHSILTPGQPVLALTLLRQEPGKVATGVQNCKPLVRLDPEKILTAQAGIDGGRLNH